MKTLRTAVIGLGNIGQAIAGNLSKSTRNFIVADRNLDKAKELSEKWGSNVEANDIADSVKNADILILAIPFGAIVEFFQQYSSDLEGKIIIDPSNAIAPDDNGGFKKIIGNDESAGEINTKFLPQNAKLVKAFGTLGVASFIEKSYQTPEKSVLFYASDDANLDSKIEELIHDSGFDALKIGGLNQSSRIEVFGDLHEFGALGKTVTLEEAQQKL